MNNNRLYRSYKKKTPTKTINYLYSNENILTEYTTGNTTTKKNYINGLGTDDVIAVDQLEPNLTIQERGELNFCNERVIPYASEFAQYGYTNITNRCNSLGGSGAILVTNRYYFHKDNLGSIVGITDNSGTTVTTYDYDSYGNTRLNGIDIGNERLFTGREYDSETGLYYNRARYYNPKLGRFISQDPIGQVDDVNLYAYVGNNPMNATDPSGMNSKSMLEQASDLLNAIVESWGKSLFWGGSTVAAVSAPVCVGTIEVTGGCVEVSLLNGGGTIPFCYVSGVSAGASCAVTGLGIGAAMIGNQMQSSSSGGSQRGIGGKGWRGDKNWKQTVKQVGKGGTIEDINGTNPTKEEALDLIKEAGGVTTRDSIVEGPHEAPNPHNYWHINYVIPKSSTSLKGIEGTIKILQP